MKKFMMGLVLALGVLAAGGKAEAYTYTEPAKDYKNYKAPAKDYEAWDITFDVTYDYTTAYQILEAVNDYREANGACRLQTNDTLMKHAMKRSMSVHMYLDHSCVYPNDYNCLVDSNNYSICNAGSNLYKDTGGVTVEGALNGWKNSPGHNYNMLRTSWVGAGVGIFEDSCVIEFYGSNRFAWNDPKFGTDTRLTNYSERVIMPVTEYSYKPVLGSFDYTTSGIMSSDENYPQDVTGRDYVKGVGCMPTSFPITSVTIHMAGCEDNIWYTFKAPACNFTFTSSNPSVAKVEGNQVTFVGYGKADITATLNGTNYSKTYSFEYKAPQEEKKVSKPVKLKKVSNLKIKRYEVKGHKTLLGVSWKGIKGVESYNVQVAKDKKFKKLLVNKKYTGYTSAGITKKFKGKKVYVRVRAVNGKKTGPWSKVKTIKTYK